MSDDTEYERLSSEAQLLYKKGDYEGAFNNYLKLADAGHEEVQCFLGWMYLFGKGTKQNLERATHWLVKAADREDRKAQWYLGRAYLGQQNYEIAAYWFERSAQQNYGPGIYRLARLYHYGAGVPKNKSKEIELLEQAATTGNLKAQSIYARRLMVGYKGVKGILEGISLFVRTAIDGFKTAWANPNDERLTW